MKPVNGLINSFSRENVQAKHSEREPKKLRHWIQALPHGSVFILISYYFFNGLIHGPNPPSVKCTLLGFNRIPTPRVYMKAYEFYVLLGKYKRRSISQAEFERFQHAMETVRSFRYAFYESTGEYLPHFPKITTRKQVAGMPSQSNSSSQTPTAAVNGPTSAPSTSDRVSSVAKVSPMNEFVEHGWSSAAVAREKSHPASKSDDAVTGMIEQHKVFRKVRSQRKHGKLRWYRLLRDVGRHNPFIVFLLVVVCIAVGVLMTVKPGFSNKALKNHKGADLTTLASEKANPEIPNSSLTAGRFMSEADKLLAVDAKSFELNIDTSEPLQVPVTGLEAAINDGLEAMFPDPAEVLPEIETTEVAPVKIPEPETIATPNPPN